MASVECRGRHGGPGTLTMYLIAALKLRFRPVEKVPCPEVNGTSRPYGVQRPRRGSGYNVCRYRGWKLAVPDPSWAVETDHAVRCFGLLDRWLIGIRGPSFDRVPCSFFFFALSPSPAVRGDNSRSCMLSIRMIGPHGPIRCSWRSLISLKSLTIHDPWLALARSGSPSTPVSAAASQEWYLTRE